MASERKAEEVKDMSGKVSGIWGKVIAIGIVLAMLFSTGFAFAENATAEPLEPADDSTPPVPPFMLWGMIYGEDNMPVLDTTVIITNLMTGESLIADVYGDGAYDAELEDLQQGYSIGDEIKITATAGENIASKSIVVKQMGFGEPVDIRFGDRTNSASNEKILASGFESLREPGDFEIMANHERPHVPYGPRDSAINPNTIYIDSGEPIEEPAPEISLTDIRCPPYFRVAFTGKENNIRMTLANDGIERRIVIVDLYHVEPDGETESFLKTVHFGMIQPGRTKMKDAFDKNDDMWTPTERGRNWIRGEIYIKGHGNERIFIDEFRESFNVVPGWRPVMHVQGDWIINEPTVVENKTIIVDGHVYINADSVMNNGTLLAGDFIVSASETIGAGFEVDLWCNYSGEFKVEVKEGATLNVYGNITNNPQQYHYWFYMNGTLLISKSPLPQYPPGLVENVMGSPDLSQPGGIICTTDN